MANMVGPLASFQLKDSLVRLVELHRMIEDSSTLAGRWLPLLGEASVQHLQRQGQRRLRVMGV